MGMIEIEMVELKKMLADERAIGIDIGKAIGRSEKLKEVQAHAE